MELYRDVYRIESLFGGRNLFQYLFVGDRIVLVDTGIADTPEKVIFPFMDRLKLAPDRLSLALVTHADLDHQGGSETIQRISPNTQLACGAADREMIESPDTLFEKRYNFLRDEHEVGLDAEPWPEAGKPCKVDRCFSGGEKIQLRSDWELEVLHVPGHSQGHLALYDAGHKRAFVGDAIHGRGCPKATGELAIPVTYYQVDIYLSTLRYFEGLAIDALHSGHWPVKRGEEIRDFIAESRQTVEFIDRVILKALKKNPAGLTLKELIEAVANAVGDWPQDSWVLAMFPVKGHMDRLEEQDRVSRRPGTRPLKWVLTSP